MNYIKPINELLDQSSNVSVKSTMPIKCKSAILFCPLNKENDFYKYCEHIAKFRCFYFTDIQICNC